MILIFCLYSLLLFSLIISWKYTGSSIEIKSKLLIGFIFYCFIVLFVTFRDGNILRDYSEYVYYFNRGGGRDNIEESFYIIVAIVRYIGVGFLGMFFVYAVLGVSIRFYAIYKYSPFILYSFSIWIANFLLLNEMTQIRGAIACSLMLLILPAIYERRIIKAIILILIAFFFHRSSIVFILFFFVSPNKTYWRFWICLLGLSIILNICKINIMEILGLSKILYGIQLVKGDEMAFDQSDFRLNMFSPYPLLQMISCLACIYRYNRIKLIFPSCILFIKVGIIGLIIYSLSIYVISFRLSELFGTVQIFLYPCALKWFNGKNAERIGKIIVSVISVYILSSFIFKQNLIELN